MFIFFFSSRRRHTRSLRDWSSDVCSSDLSGGRDGLNRRTESKLAAEETAGVPEFDAEKGRRRANCDARHRRAALYGRRRSEERRVGKECRTRGSPHHYKNKNRRRG